MPKTSPKQRILAGEKLTGCWISLFSPLSAEIMAQAGYDVAMIDLEHGPGGLLEAIAMMQAVESHGCSPIIRASSSNIVDIKRVLDIGPMGIMVPNVRNAEEARSVIAHCRYAPEGDRGAAPGYMRAMGYSGFGGCARNGKEYSAFMKEDFMLILQVESANAVEEIDSIVSTEGIDMVFVGPADLSASLGNLGGFNSQDFQQAIARIESETLKAKTSLGTIPFSNWTAERLYQTGYQLVISGADAMLLASAAKKDLQALETAR